MNIQKNLYIYFFVIYFLTIYVNKQKIVSQIFDCLFLTFYFCQFIFECLFLDIYKEITILNRKNKMAIL